MYFKDFILQIKSFSPHKGCTYDCLHDILSPQLSLIPSPWFLLPYSSIISSYFWLQFIIPEVSILMKIVGFWYTLRYKTTGSCLFCHLVKKQKINKKQQQKKPLSNKKDEVDGNGDESIRTQVSEPQVPELPPNACLFN